MEFAEDVAAHHPDGTATFEQTKSALSQNPVSDWAVDLWKTFANWVELIQSGRANAATSKFRLFVAPQKTGKWVQQLSDAKDDASIAALLDEIKKKRAKKAPTPACAPHMDAFLSAPKKLQFHLVRNFTFESQLVDPVDALRALVRAAVSDDAIDQVCEYAIGAAHKTIDRLIREKARPEIDAKVFQQAFKAFVKKHDLSNLLISIANEPPDDEVQAVLMRSPTFVQQLELIGVSVETKLRAISAYLQTVADKTEWAERGKVVPDSFDEFDKALVGKHEFIKIEIDATLSNLGELRRGQALYSRCCMSTIHLESREVPAHFVPGSYNALADQLKIGWHPEYAAHFKKAGSA